MNARVALLLVAGLIVGAIGYWMFGMPTSSESDAGSTSGEGAERETATAESAASVEDTGLLLADAGPPPPGPAVRRPEQGEPPNEAARAVEQGGQPSDPSEAVEAAPGADRGADNAEPSPDRDNAPGALDERDTQFARFVALMDTRYESFRQGAEDCVESLPPSLQAQLEVRVTRNDLGDPYGVRITGADLPATVTECLTRKARAIELPQPYQADPYESGNYDVDSQTDSEFDWIMRLQLGGS